MPGIFQDLGLPWWLRWGRMCLNCRRPRFDPWVRKILLFFSLLNFSKHCFYFREA